MKLLKYLGFVFLLLFGCSTNMNTIRDSRLQIIKALKWEQSYLAMDSTTGIIFKFNRGNNVEEFSNGINLFLWSYPLDTITVTRKVCNEVQSLPSVGSEDVTYIDYKFKNDTIKVSDVIDTTNQIHKQVPPCTYLLQINSYGFSPKYLKDIVVKKGNYSVVYITMYGYQIELY
jgi:hypothetical protein